LIKDHLISKDKRNFVEYKFFNRLDHMPNQKIRPIAIYLPQYHPIPENDEWWGKGFTEWRNVVKAKPRFKGHYQPHLPVDLGFYDLRLEEARLAQEALAKQYGIYGFCYYHYWFNGKRLLNEPIDRKMKNLKEDLPFMFCWANENWTRAWDGSNSEILIQQDYSNDDDVKHINKLLPYFKDKRYIKVGGKPVFAFYKDALFPDIKQTLRIFREEAQKQGLELYLCRFDRDEDTTICNPEILGFDASIEFQPISALLLNYKKSIQKKNSKPFTKENLLQKFINPRNYIDYFNGRIRKKKNKSKSFDYIIDFKKFIELDINQSIPDYKIFPCVSPGWDNSARRLPGKATIFQGSSPELFKYWTKAKLAKFKPYSKDENFIFINAWNEWAEGNHLEPCEKYGTSFLKAFRESLTLNQ